MSMLDAVKNAVVGQAMRWISDPRLSRVVADPRVMNAAMKAMSMGGTVKSELDKATRFAAGVFGFATQEEVIALRSTIQSLEETIATLEHRAATSQAPTTPTGG
jgi:hypothetical protein